MKHGIRPSRVVVGSLATLALVGSWASLKAALDAAPTGGVILADAPPSVPCTSPPCTYDPANYSSARFQFSATDSSFNSMNMGEALAVGDFNGDTYQDIAMAAPKGSSSKGIVFIVYGTSAAPATTFDVSNSSVIRMQGKTGGDLVGSALVAGDITGDGRTDLIVGAPGVNKVYIIPGSTTTWTSQTGTNGIENHSGLITLTGPGSNELGYSLAIGDVGAATGTSGTVDGKLDLIVGAPATSSAKGAAYVVYGPITASISPIGSAANVFTFNGGTNDDRAGATVSIFASVTESTTQASIPDIGIGAPGANSTGGKVYLIAGRARDFFLQAYGGATNGSLDTSAFQKRIIVGDLTESSATKGALGFAISGIGDVNDDSLNDIAIGVPYAPSPIGNIEAGRVYILLGSATVLDAGSSILSTLSAPYFYGESNYDQIGSSLSILGNVDGDSRDDFLIGARRLDVSSSNDLGGAYVMSGRSTGDWGFATKKIDGVRFTFPRTSDSNANSGTATSYRGLVVMGTPDLDGDGYGDFLMGAPGSDVSTGDNKGRVYYTSFGDFMDRDSDTQNRATGDCDDLDLARRYRSDGTETCDGKDNDCDGLVDDADSSLQGTAYYPDNDNDGFGNKNSSATQACSKPSGKVTNNTDCDDTKSAVNPNASEICDSIDNDCDSQIDDNDPSVTGRSTWYRDADNDTYGTTATTLAACTKPSGYVAISGDCADNDSTVNPAAQEVCNSDKDDDCDGLKDDEDPSTTGKNTYYLDADSDGYGRSDVSQQTCKSAPPGYSASNTDCNDLNPAIYPGATETCNSVDDNCDGKIDAADPAVTGTSNYYPDSDKDGFGSSSATAEKACPNSAPSGKVTSNNDCNDSDATVYPGATEVCNSNKDDDCDGLKDDADPGISGQSTWYQDSDADSYGNASKSTKLCTQPTGYVANNTDCNDTNPAIKPGAQEICDNGVDNDCDTLIDDNDPTIYDGQVSITKLVTYYQDSDNDGYGKDAVTTQKCSQPSGYSGQKGDCNDGNNSIYPGAAEGKVQNTELGCINGDTLDNDCDGIEDEGTCEYDDDQDGQTERDGDCNDTNPTIYTGAAEVCNGVDEDCDDKTDEDYDDDNDGYLDEALCTGVVLPNATDCDDKDPNVYEGATVLCDGKDTDCDGTTTDTGYSSEADSDRDGQRACAGDCDDKDPEVYLDAPELCDVKDNNCNGTVDEVLDDDLDGSTQCDDCDDNDATSNPSASEICDGKDNNCDTILPPSELDTDEDGFRVCEEDCDDNDEAIFPENPEFCDEKDNDCNDLVDDDASDFETFYQDGDGDGYGAPGATTETCEVPPGYQINSDDCDDFDATVYKDAPAVCDGIDHDCDGQADYLVADFDADNDGFLSASLCSGLPSDYKLDCDDSNKTVNPDAVEVAFDGIDNNCDGTLSEGGTAEALTGGCSCSTPATGSTAPTFPAAYGLLGGVALVSLLRRRSTPSTRQSS